MHSAASSNKAEPPTESLPGATYALVILTVINLLNYVDRYVPSATKSLFQADLHLTDTETSLPLTGFLIVYMLTSPIFGAMSDRGFSRKGLICAGVVVWSLATAAGALSTNFATFMLARMGVGVGEAAYATIAPALLSDYHPPHKRSKVLSVFYAAIPIGAAIGFSVGGVVGDHAGWRVAFLVCGLPGLAAAVAVLWIREPPLGSMDIHSAANTGPPVTWRQVLTVLPRNSTYVYTVGGSIFAIFGSGGMADWFPTYLERVHHINGDTSASLIGAVTVIGGFAGTGLGSILADKLKGRTRNPYLFVSAVGLGVCCAMSFLVMLVPSSVGLIGFLLLVAQLFLWMYNGPTNALVANCVDPRIRTRAFSISILMGHAFGDAISPAIVGGISDSTGSLATAVLIIPFSFALATLIWFIGWRYAVRAVDPLTLEAAQASGTATDGSAVVRDSDRDPLTSINGSGSSGGGVVDSRQILLLNDHLPSDDVASALRTPGTTAPQELMVPASSSSGSAGSGSGDGRVELSRKPPNDSAAVASTGGTAAADNTSPTASTDFASML